MSAWPACGEKNRPIAPKGRCNADAYRIAVHDGVQAVLVVVQLTPAPDGFFFKASADGGTLCRGFAPGDVAAVLERAAWAAARRLAWDRCRWQMLFTCLRSQGLEAGQQFPLCKSGERCPRAEQARERPACCFSPICRAWEATPEEEVTS
jgi:hypothetical protein